MIQEKAKAIVRKIKLQKLLFGIIIVAVFVLGYFKFRVSEYSMIAYWLLYFFGIYFFTRVLNNHMIQIHIYPILLNSLDMPLFIETLNKGNFYDKRTKTMQITAEYVAGNYAAAIDICKSALENKKLQRYKYYYWTNLANCYFDIGDDEKLREVTEAFKASLAKEKEKVKLRIKNRYPRICLLDLYVQGEYDACRELLSTSDDSTRYSNVRIDYNYARLSHAKGDMEAALAMYEKVIAEGGELNIVTLAKRGIEAIKNQVEYAEMFKEDLPVSEFTCKVNPKAGRGVLVACAVFVAIVIILNVIAPIITARIYENKVEKAIESDYENVDVEVLATFDVEQDGELLERMFICQTSDEIWLGSLYYYDYDPDLHAEVVSAGGINELDAYFSLFYGFSGVVEEDIFFFSRFTEEKPDFGEYITYAEFEIEERKVYFTVTNTVEYENT